MRSPAVRKKGSHPQSGSDSAIDRLYPRLQLSVCGREYGQYHLYGKAHRNGTVNYRNGVTDENGTFTSSWYTTYSFDRCTIEEWTVSNVTDTTASIVSTPYSGEITLTTT